MKANRFTIPNVIFRNKTLTVRINTLKSRKISETKTNFKMTQKQTKRKKIIHTFSLKKTTSATHKNHTK